MKAAATIAFRLHETFAAGRKMPANLHGKQVLRVVLNALSCLGQYQAASNGTAISHLKRSGSGDQSNADKIVVQEKVISPVR